MNAELLIIKGLVSEMSPADQEKFKAACDAMRNAAKQHGDFAMLALGVIAQELLETEKKGKS